MDLPPTTGAGPDSTGNHETAEREPSDVPRIYVASLSDYVAGILHGEWIDATQEPEELNEAVQGMLRRSPSGHAEEFAIHDFEHFSHYQPEEYDSLDWISRIARGMGEHGPAFSAWATHCDRDDETIERFDEAYLGDWRSLADYAEEILDDLGYLDLSDRVPDAINPYVRVDVDGFARDLVLSGDITVVEHDHGIWIFDG